MSEPVLFGDAVAKMMKQSKEPDKEIILTMAEVNAIMYMVDTLAEKVHNLEKDVAEVRKVAIGEELRN